MKQNNAGKQAGRRLLMPLALALLAVGGAPAASVTLNMYTDDYGILAIDGTTLGSYNNSSSAGNVVATVDLAAGWHSIAIDYANQAGTNALVLNWILPGDSAYSVVPLSDFRSLNQSGTQISGLRADYYSSLNGPLQFTVFGEGPIVNYAASFTNEIYEGQPGLWAGVFGPSSLFAERLRGEIFVPSGATPEPGCAVLFGVGAVAACLARRKALHVAGESGCVLPPKNP